MRVSSAFPYYYIDNPFGIDRSYPGTLFAMPRRATKPDCREYYRTIEVSGWSTCPAGYAVYTQFTSGGAKLVFPGLKISGLSTIKGKSSGLSIFLNKTDFESHISAVLSIYEHYEHRTYEGILNVIHEVKSINSNIYNTSMRLNNILDNDQFPSLTVSLALDIVHQSSMLSIRTNFEQIKFAPEVTYRKEYIPVYRVFDKVVRTFISKAKKTNNSILLSGHSFGTVYGPKIIEVIAFLSIENALKYSPQGYDINVDINETEQEIEIKLHSVGPKVEIYEKDKIFRRNYRGVNAKRSGKSGSG